MISSHDSCDAADTWQQILAQDTRFSHVRPSMCDNQQMRNLYLRRRHQLSKEFTHLVDSGEHFDRHLYKKLREQILVHVYGSCGSLRLSLNNGSFVKPLDGACKDDLSADVFFPDSREGSNFDQLSFRSNYDQPTVNSETLTETYAFSGIDRIFDHHTKAINRLRFANNDHTRLAIASADGTISLCYILPPECQNHVVHLTGGHRFGASVTDVAWSLGNDFLVSTAVDGSVCVWDAVSGSVKRHYTAESLNMGPVLVCAFQPQNYNLLVLGGAWGVIQTLNLSTGKLIKTGRDQIHLTRFKPLSTPATHRRPADTQILEFHCTGTGSITAMTFEPATGTCLWVGTDRGVIQSYLCIPSSGQLTRSHRIDFASIYATPGKNNRGKLSRLNPMMLRRKSPGDSAHPYHSVTSLSFHSWLSSQNQGHYLLGNAAGLGLLLLEVIPFSGGNLIVRRQFPMSHHPPSGGQRVRLIHSGLAPLLSMRSGACAVTGSEDSIVYLFDVLVQGRGGVSTAPLPPGLVTMLQGHTAPVLDVAIGWDESVLASGDENGTVIVWRRTQSSDRL